MTSWVWEHLLPQAASPFLTRVEWKLVVIHVGVKNGRNDGLVFKLRCIFPSKVSTVKDIQNVRIIKVPLKGRIQRGLITSYYNENVTCY